MHRTKREFVNEVLICLVAENGRSQNYPRWYRRLADMPVPGHRVNANKAVEAGVHTSFVHSSIIPRLSPENQTRLFISATKTQGIFVRDLL